MENNDFDKERTGTGTKEWSEHSINIQTGCSNNCLYCYGATNAVRFDIRARDDWHREELTKTAINRRSYPKKDGVVMMPTAHDISPYNLTEYIRTAKLILQAGNQLLIVSKPDAGCIAEVMAALRNWKEQILFRFTIGSMSEATCSFWEPRAPSPSERLLALQMAHSYNWQTSVSIEPMLSGVAGAIEVVEAVRDYVTDTIWLGKMNKPALRVSKEHAAAVEHILTQQRDAEILRLFTKYKNDPKIRWKDSIKQVIAKYREGV